MARGIAQTASMALNNARLIEEVEQANHVKSEFLSTMSHEMRTPLGALLGYAEILADGGVDAAEQAHCIQRIRGVGAELLELIERRWRSAASRPFGDEVRLEPIRLHAFCAALAEQCAQMVRHGEVAFDWHCEVPNAAIVTDPRKLSVVLRNLISNGFKFTEHGIVRFEAQLSADRVTFRVSDTGAGIAPADQQLIFEMFRQGEGTTPRHHGGTGLGLYIVRRFVDQLGGAVTLASTPGIGSTFTVMLPRAPDRAEKRQRAGVTTLRPAVGPTPAKGVGAPARRPVTNRRTASATQTSVANRISSTSHVVCRGFGPRGRAPQQLADVCLSNRRARAPRPPTGGPYGTGRQAAAPLARGRRKSPLGFPGPLGRARTDSVRVRGA